MLRIAKLADAEYLIGQVALGIDDYYMGAGEAPGVWQGRLADELGLSGVVDADQLRALLLGRDPTTNTELVSARRPRTVAAFDVTFLGAEIGFAAVDVRFPRGGVGGIHRPRRGRRRRPGVPRAARWRDPPAGRR